MKQCMRKWRSILMEAGMAAAMFCGMLAHSEEKKEIDVLMISGNESRGQIGAASLSQPGWHKFKAACAAQGVRVHILGEGGSPYKQLTPELFRQFQVIVCAGAPHNQNTDAVKIAEGAAFCERLDAYNKAGGGIIWMPVGHDHDPITWTEAFGRRYDARALEEKLYDPPRILHVNTLLKGPRFDYLWTRNITAHPVTDGVRGLLLPRQGDYDSTGTVPMQYGKTWTTLIRGMDTARTIGYSELSAPPEGNYKATIKGTYDSMPEILGVRESDNGSGRMMVFPFHPAHTWCNFNSWVLNDAMMLKGWDEYPSDGMKLFLNACRWLAEPAQKAGLGGYVPPREKTYAEVPPLDWSKAEYPVNSWSGMGAWFNARTQEDVTMSDFVTPNARDFKGLLGARTSYGDGSGTVAEYAAAAKKLGLSFVIFLEDLEKIDEARYAKLVADCKANSSADFRAMPGYLFRDTIDVLYYIVNAPQLPKTDQLTPERKVKAPNDLIICGNNYAAGGIAELGKIKIDPYFLLSYFTVAPYVYDNGRLVDDGFQVYRSLQGRMHHMSPVSLTIVRSPAEMADTVANAHLVVYHAEDLSTLENRLGHNKLWNPNPVYITSGPSITRWGTLNPIGQPYSPGKQRVRFALEAHGEDGISDVKIIEARSGKLFRHYRPGGVKDFACTIDETHKDQWYLIPLVTDSKGRTALGPTIETFQDGNRVNAYLDNIDSGHMVIGWDEKHQKLNQWGGWMVPPYHKGGYYAGDMPPNPASGDMSYHGVDGGNIGCGHCEVVPQVVTGTVTEPKIAAYYFENWLASFDNVIGNYAGHSQFLKAPLQKLPGCNWTSSTAAPEPMEYVDIHARVEAVRARYHAPFSVNINQVDVAFKKDCTLKRINLARTFNRVQTGPMYVAGKDRDGEWSGLDDGEKNKFSRSGLLGPGDYIFPGSDYSGAPAVVNLGETPLSYTYSGFQISVYIDGKDRPVKMGETITARFLILTKPWEGQNNSFWLKKFIADYAVGGGKPAYNYTLEQGKLKNVNYAMNLEAENGGATVTAKKYDLPHNLLVKLGGMSANTVAGRYDLDKKQLLILPVFEGTATSSINTSLGDTRLYVGELFHCNDPEVMFSCVQSGVDRLLLEVHNPTDKAKTVKLAAVPGFTALAGLDKTVEVPPCSSVKLELTAAAGTLSYTAYQGD